MYIFSTEHIREWDEYTIQHEPIKSIDLMERAALACVSFVTQYINHTTPFVIICGKGNNGGDGLAMARLLIQRRYKVHVILIHYSPNITPDCAINLERLEKEFPSVVQHIHEASDLKQIVPDKQALLIDALFGTGLNKPVDGLAATAIEWMNTAGSGIISIDIPSGLYADRSSSENKYIVKSGHVLTFQTAKLAFLMAENAAYAPRFDVLDIGLHPAFTAQVKSPFTFLQADDVRIHMELRKRFSHKGSYGHALLMGGSKGKSGAILLAAKACLRSGAGLLTVHSCRESIQALHIGLPEAMTSEDPYDAIGELPKTDRYTAIGVGPGLGTEDDTERVLKALIQNSTQTLVFDADAINILAENKTWLSFIPPRCIFTPHVKEFDRLTETHTSDFDRLKTAIAFCRKHEQIMVLKGAYSAIITPEGKVYFNSTGNPALAKGGSGDVLTGMITALSARHYTSELACVVGVYIHGLAAELCTQTMSMESVLASDIIYHIAQAFKLMEPAEPFADSKQSENDL
ncbi:MAG: NAD(P)H-hydrate dehydratase [Bacteroidetes bacterium]|nr:NAD(P)H-hydrate dehydratase [Bacteroidota bacterium]